MIHPPGSGKEFPVRLLRRRPLLAALPALAFAPGAWALPPLRLQFPRDHGAHPQRRTEWWYITGQAESGGRLFGFQVTFFRSRVEATQGMAYFTETVRMRAQISRDRMAMTRSRVSGTGVPWWPPVAAMTVSRMA